MAVVVTAARPKKRSIIGHIHDCQRNAGRRLTRDRGGGRGDRLVQAEAWLLEGLFGRRVGSGRWGDRGDTLAGSRIGLGSFDNDGRRDLFVSRTFRPNQLFHNEGPDAAGRVRFRDVTAGSGLGEDCCTTVASWGDVDDDGLLDLYVGRYLDRIVVEDGRLKFAEKLCVFDTSVVPTSLIYPI